MKKTYVSPKAEVINFAPEDQLLANSHLTTDGNTNTSISISSSTEGGSGFRSQQRGGWSSDNWSGAADE